MDIDAILDEAFASRGLIVNSTPRAPKLERDSKPKPVCRVPDCKTVLKWGGKSGVCRNHNHVKPYCRCSRCSRPSNKPSFSEAITEWRAGQLRDRVGAGMLLSEAAAQIGISYALARQLAGVK